MLLNDSARTRTIARSERAITMATLGTGILQRACACGQHTGSSVECEECNKKHEGTLQRAVISAPPMGESPPIVQDILRSSGQPFNAPTRSFMQPRFGHDFSRVRVNADSEAEKQDSRLDPFALASNNFRTDHELVLERDAPQFMPVSTLAWTDRGMTHLIGAALLLSSRERKAILRHEAAHRWHQQHRPISNAANAEPAEQFARAVESGQTLTRLPIRGPVPPVLAYPPQAHSPWNQVWLGHPGIIGEILENDVRVRIFLKYEELGLNAAQDYQCGQHPVKKLPDLAAQMKRAARKAAELNERIKQSAAQRVALIVIATGNTRYRQANGQGTIVIDEKEFASKEMEDTIAHETSHGIFEFHLTRQDPQKRMPDNLILQVTDLYLKLGQTVQLPTPTALFDAKHPPPLKNNGSTTLKPAGYLIVFDTLWSGTGGHPWENVDEFFASAYAVFTQQLPRLKQIIAHYAKADPNVNTLGTKLIDLLGKVSDPKLYETLSRPSKVQAAETEIAGVAPPEDVKNDPTITPWLFDPTKMPAPNQIICKNP